MRSAFARVHASGWYVLGPEVEAFEADFAAFVGAPHAVGCASGTDAITLALRALGIGAGDDVLTVSMTCAPTATGIVNAGARPVFVDVDPATLTMDPARLARGPDAADESGRPGPSLRAAGADGGDRRASPGPRGPRGRRGLRAGAWRPAFGTERRELRRRGGLELLPDEEPRGARGRRPRDRRGTPPSRRGCGASGCTATRRGTTPRSPASTAASTSCRRRSFGTGWRACREAEPPPGGSRGAVRRRARGDSRPRDSAARRRPAPSPATTSTSSGPCSRETFRERLRRAGDRDRRPLPGRRPPAAGLRGLRRAGRFR